MLVQPVVGWVGLLYCTHQNINKKQNVNKDQNTAYIQLINDLDLDVGGERLGVDGGRKKEKEMRMRTIGARGDKWDGIND